MLHQGQDLQLNFVYDTKQHVKEINANGKKLVSYIYDNTGNLQEVVNAAGRMRYESDANKLVTQVIQDDKPVFAARFDEFGRWRR
jgi:YD repeat-containing protein